MVTCWADDWSERTYENACTRMLLYDVVAEVSTHGTMGWRGREIEKMGMKQASRDRQNRPTPAGDEGSISPVPRACD